MSNSIKIGAKMEKLASVNITYNSIKVGDSVGVYPSSKDKNSLSNLLLKPLTYFSYDTGGKNYVLNINVLANSNHLADENNAVECKTVGKNVLVFLNYSKIVDPIVSDNYLNYRYQITFDDQLTGFLKGKEILIVTASGDPQEGSATKVIIEDEDEI